MFKTALTTAIVLTTASARSRSSRIEPRQPLCGVRRPGASFNPRRSRCSRAATSR